MMPIHYVGWIIIILAILRFYNKAYLDIKWKFAFSTFTALYSMGKLCLYYTTPEVANVMHFISAGAFLIPFLKINYLLLKDVEKISDTSLLLGMGIIVLLS